VNKFSLIGGDFYHVFLSRAGFGFFRDSDVFFWKSEGFRYFHLIIIMEETIIMIEMAYFIFQKFKRVNKNRLGFVQDFLKEAF
jgi:hypothetical protein